jgi:hypothetical protein
VSVQQFLLPIVPNNQKRDAAQSPKSSRAGGNVDHITFGVASGLLGAGPHFFCRLASPKPSPVYATYWKFAKARQDVFFARLAGTESRVRDKIIARHRFTNAYRASDRVSQYLIRHVLYEASWSPVDLVFRLLIFKLFNKIETWKALEREFGVISWDTYDFHRYDRSLSRMMAAGERIYSGAYIMPSGRTAFGFERKHKNHLKIVETMIAEGVPSRITECNSLEKVFQLLRQFPCLGPFIGYQFTIDLNYSALLNFSENDFVVPGPGALDGIAKCFSRLGDLGPADIIRYVADIQEQAFEEFGPGFRTLWGRRLHLIDCQNLFCEVSKYARIAHPTVEGLSNRKRIKQLYRPSAEPSEKPWFPPKWGLNHLIASDAEAQL